jgi:3-hydroxymyristoyl/3-hydroxydecanoyl-(acyl carrier protein) dehydratase
MIARKTVSVRGDHPALAGHYPGHPVVPAVVILYEIIAAIEEASFKAIEIADVPTVKFLSPLAPDEDFTIEIEQHSGTSVEFTGAVGMRLVARGCLAIRILGE